MRRHRRRIPRGLCCRDADAPGRRNAIGIIGNMEPEVAFLRDALEGGRSTIRRSRWKRPPIARQSFATWWECWAKRPAPANTCSSSPWAQTWEPAQVLLEAGHTTSRPFAAWAPMVPTSVVSDIERRQLSMILAAVLKGCSGQRFAKTPLFGGAFFVYGPICARTEGVINALVEPRWVKGWANRGSALVAC